MLDKARWRKLNAIWESVLKLPAGRRSTHIRAACANDESLRMELVSLLRHEENAGDFLEPPQPSDAVVLSGRTLAHYEVIDKLGEGGMGTVYKARDTHLNRFVALKILSPASVGDPSRRARFVREAKAASALNHPNIVQVYDIDCWAGVDFIAMEFVAGETLAQLIPRNGMPVTDALKLAVQIAGALARAHSAGIIHRDLKPANIMVDAYGTVKLLDFGLAKLTEQTATDLQRTAATGASTEEGTIVGSAGYMSPEQAEGKPVDHRSDVFSFGSVLYEMVTGRRSFHGDSPVSTLWSVLHQQPEQIPEDVPRDVRRLITRCLRKDPAWRYQSMGDLTVALAELALESPPAGPAPGAAPLVDRRRWIVAAVALGVFAVATATGGIWLVRRPPAGQEFAHPVVVPLTAYAGNEISPSFSPDGSQFAFSWDGEKQDNSDIYVRLVDGGSPLRLTTHPAADSTPAWSPDGRWIAFHRDGPDSGIYLVSPLGGSERKLAPGGYTLPCWTPDAKSLVYAKRDSESAPYSLWMISIQTGEHRKLTSPPTTYFGDVGCAVSPDGTKLALTRWVLPAFGGGVWLFPMGGGEPRRLTRANIGAQTLSWIGSGDEILFSASRATAAPTMWEFGEGSLWRLRLANAGEAVPLKVEGIDQNSTWASISRANPGRPSQLAYARYEFDTNIRRLDVGTRRSPGTLTTICSSTRGELWPAISPDGQKIIFASQRSGTRQIWSCDSNGSNPEQLTSIEGAVGTPSWSPDGRRIAFDILNEGNRDVYVMNSDGTGLRRMTTEPANDGRATWSRDGRWIYFHSARTGTHEIWKIPAEGGPAIQLTRSGGSEPRESPDGRQVYYVKSISRGGLWSVLTEGGAEKEVFAGIQRGDWTVGSRGVYFLGTAVEGFIRPIQLFDPATARLITLGRTDDVAPLRDSPRLSVSPDGSWLIWVQFDRLSTDLMLVKNFR